MSRCKHAQRPMPTTLFSFHDGTFVAEISDLRDQGPFCSRVGLVNPKTHGEVWFDLDTIDRDGEGDVAGWRFKSADKRHPNLKVLIIND